MADNDWIKRRAKKLRDQDSAEETRRKWQMHKHEVLAAHGPTLWDSMIRQLLEGAAEFNREMNADQRIDRVEQTAQGAILQRATPPFVKVEAGYEEKTQVIRIAIMRALRGLPAEMKPVQVELDLTDEGHVLFVSQGRRMTDADLAQALIEEFFEGLE